MTNLLETLIDSQRTWSRHTFGDGRRTLGIVKHIRKELSEIESNPTDLKEWVDVIILALDGAWRAGYEPCEIVMALLDKHEENKVREWPTPKGEDEPVEHIRVEGLTYSEETMTRMKAWVIGQMTGDEAVYPEEKSE